MNEQWHVYHVTLNLPLNLIFAPGETVPEGPTLMERLAEEALDFLHNGCGSLPAEIARYIEGITVEVLPLDPPEGKE